MTDCHTYHVFRHATTPDISIRSILLIPILDTSPFADTSESRITMIFFMLFSKLEYFCLGMSALGTGQHDGPDSSENLRRSPGAGFNIQRRHGSHTSGSFT